MFDVALVGPSNELSSAFHGRPTIPAALSSAFMKEAPRNFFPHLKTCRAIAAPRLRTGAKPADGLPAPTAAGGHMEQREESPTDGDDVRVVPTWPGGREIQLAVKPPPLQLLQTVTTKRRSTRRAGAGVRRRTNWRTPADAN
ncbi:unnamed protein product [Heligmosomoides polygyrus]|uniref:Uncharacterized protein n=1 Tax=Heligmosomoides polygyrus TaxID=6339 RepID=A0A183FRY6_HELPZ|nr:unnamed protein product [Heligmosomoides polygyrus]